MSQKIDDLNCELCGEYCGDKTRLTVKLPEELQEKYEVEKMKLCEDCIKAHCKDTISDYWFKFYFPRSKRDAEV